MNKNIIYISLALVLGLLIGFLIFDGKAKNTSSDENLHEHAEATDQMWTCSMHPQIMQPEPGDCPICGMDLIPAESGAEGLSPNEIKMTKNAMALANIQTSIIGDAIETEGSTFMLSGKIMRNEEANAVQASYFEGRIEKLNINFTGERVSKGQLLATIYAPSLVVTQQELLTTASMKDSQPALYNSVRNKLKLLKLSEKQINDIEASGKVREFFPIYATVSGTVAEKMAVEGDYVAQGQPILKVSNLGTVWAMFDAYENQISQLKIGQKISVTTNAYPDKKYEAKIAFIDPILNVSSRTIPVRVTLNNSDGLLKPGMFAVGQLDNIGGSAVQELQVPTTSVLWTGQRSLVYIKTNPNEPIFEMREVTLGKRTGENYIIKEGLEKGDEIVTNGTFTVDAAAQLQGKKSMMNQHKADQSNDGSSSEPIEKLVVSDKFQLQLKKVFDSYIELKDALVADKSASAKKAAQELENNLTKVDVKLLDDKDATQHWTKIEKEIKSSANSIANNTDIAKQRNHFKNLSSNMITSVHQFGINTTVYSAYCPMADDDKGAYWLTVEKEIRNPYYGDAMLKCGEIKETIK